MQKVINEKIRLRYCITGKVLFFLKDTKSGKVARRTNWVRKHDCRNVAAGRKAWMLLITGRQREKRHVDGNARSGNKHTPYK